MFIVEKLCTVDFSLFCKKVLFKLFFVKSNDLSEMLIKSLSMFCTVNTFNFCLHLFFWQKWPDQEAPEFKLVVTTFFKKCKNLANRILDVIGIGLDLKVTNLSSMIFDNYYSMLTLKCKIDSI